MVLQGKSDGARASLRGDAAYVQVVFATGATAAIVAVQYYSGLTAGEAARRSGLLERCLDVDPRAPILGVFGVAVAEQHRLEPGDRVEICRPLNADPRARRREAAARGGVMIARKPPS